MSFSSVEFTRAPEVSAEFAGRVRSLLRASALGAALGYPLELLSAEQIAESAPKPWDSAFGELLVSDDTQLTCFTLDALTEVLEWNNEGAAADELACLWLAYLRWFRGIGEVLPESAPFSLDREIDGAPELTARRGPGAAALRALGSGEMQLVSKSLNPDALGRGALVRSGAAGWERDESVGRFLGVDGGAVALLPLGGLGPGQGHEAASVGVVEVQARGVLDQGDLDASHGLAQ